METDFLTERVLVGGVRDTSGMFCGVALDFAAVCGGVVARLELPERLFFRTVPSVGVRSCEK